MLEFAVKSVPLVHLGIHAVSAYKKRLYKKRLVDGLKVKKRTLVDFYRAKKRSSYLHSQKLSKPPKNHVLFHKI